jgi:DNA-binding SARP family transcriptional activator
MPQLQTSAYPPEMPLVIRLLGAPSIEIDGLQARSPRGRKSWGLLAYILLAERPPSRQRLAALLFADADDPLGALRWSLAEIRRSLRPHAEVSGDPLAIRFVADEAPIIDILEAADIPVAGLADGELLEGMTFEGCDAFETWLLVERRRLAAVVEGALHEHALHRLATGDAAEATAVASRLVAINPLDENFQELLVRCLATSGQREAALTQASNCRELFVRELGVEPSPSLRRAADVAAGSISSPPQIGSAAACAQLEAGRAAISAGAVDAGLDCLRRATGEAEASGDRHLHVEALVELGGALVHAVRGRDEEGAAVLHEALAMAQATGDPQLTATPCRELGFIDVQAGRRERADSWLAEAERLVEGDDAALAAILGVRGMNLSDSARYGDALEVLEASVEHADRAGSRRQRAWSAALVGRIYLITGRTAEARTAIDDVLAIAQDERWTAFAPWPETLRGDVDLDEREVDSARDRYAHAFALACELGDPCWEGVAAKGLGLVEARRGDPSLATAWLDDARSRCTRWPDAYQWVHAAVLDATCDIAIDLGDERSSTYVEQLATVASRAGLRDLVVRSHVHRARLGQPGALEAAAIGAADIDNPVLAALVEGVTHGR